MIVSWRFASAGLLLFAAHAVAQVSSNFAYQQAATTGMAGFTSAQTARLNVLNVSPLAAAAQSCKVQLAFYDEKNNLLKQSTVIGLAPQTATSLDLNRPEVASVSPTALRAQIRGVVLSGLPLLANPVAPGASVIVVSACTVTTTLEIFDSATGVTQVITSDTRPGMVVPATAGKAAM
jgi:hypothetical protein